jgi:two-component system CheB/CheR fusion protein
MNEELQSMNEELQMLNHELNVKVNDLSRLNNDMKNLLDSTELTTLFLDGALNVRLFTMGSSRIFRLMPGDVGRPITDIASDLLYSGTGGQRAGGAADVDRSRPTDDHSGRALVPNAHHALSYAG